MVKNVAKLKEVFHTISARERKIAAFETPTQHIEERVLRWVYADVG